jgi:hypothetical protein
LLAGIIQLVTQYASQYNARAQSAAYNWLKKKLNAALEHPWLSEFPYLVQLLLLGEIKDLVKLAKKGADANLRLTELGKCHCRFARSYWLLCKHVIYAFNFLDKIKEPN